MGTGLAYPVNQVEFHHNCWKDIEIKIGGQNVDDWKFWLQDLGKGHWVSSATSCLKKLRHCMHSKVS